MTMREVVFRGKLKADNGEHKKGDWGYGDLVRMKDGNNIKTFIYGFGEVDPETVGQYIGQNDKNHKKVFEGDVLYHKPKYSLKAEKYYIFFEDSSFYYRDPTKEYGTPIDDNEFGLNVSHYKIIGNIHDNPELIKDGEYDAN
ncbi:MAG: YopX family protein [Acutalibacteraceae bacterium]|nr:YopX family protein [Acutalibacteraceae bacterium]